MAARTMRKSKHKQSKHKQSKHKQSKHNKKHHKSRRRHNKSKKYTMKGGNKPLFYKMKKSAIPPFYGYAWELGKPNTWPGVAKVPGASNYFALNKYNEQPGYNGYTTPGY